MASYVYIVCIFLHLSVATAVTQAMSDQDAMEVTHTGGLSNEAHHGYLMRREQKAWEMAEATVGKVAAWMEKIRDAYKKYRPAIARDDLRTAEHKFTHGEVAHGDIGGDRMTTNGYAPIYAKYLPFVADKVTNPAIAEVGILAGTGLAMWRELFPSSSIFGFDINTATYEGNLVKLKGLGFKDSNVRVTQMDQTSDECPKKFASVFQDSRLSIVIDDGYHVPENNVKTFKQMKPFLAETFVYFIEDVYPDIIENQPDRWGQIQASLREACIECEVHIEKPEDYEGHVKTSRVVVLTRG